VNNLVGILGAPVTFVTLAVLVMAAAFWWLSVLGFILQLILEGVRALCGWWSWRCTATGQGVSFAEHVGSMTFTKGELKYIKATLDRIDASVSRRKEGTP
jgi:hypothetical protein